MNKLYTHEEVQRLRRLSYIEGKIDGITLGISPPPHQTVFELMEPLHREASALTIQQLAATEAS